MTLDLALSYAFVFYIVESIIILLLGWGADLAQVNLFANCWPNQAKMSVIGVFQLQFTCSIHDLGPNVCLTPACPNV